MNRVAKVFAISVPAVLLAAALLGAAVELWTRARWDSRKGTPGFFLSHPVRRQQLSPGYRGWFAGVPVAINSLGLRDSREYPLAKSPRTIRILVLGDSVTFGHGSIYEHSYPFLLEQRLKAWRPAIDWQVWNAAVPGYNTSQELAQLLEIGPRVEPDLVIVGFYENDIVDNFPVREATMAARVRSAVLSWVYRHIYSIELYKRLYFQMVWKVSRENSYQLRLAHVAEEEQLIAHDDMTGRPEQRLTRFDTLDASEPTDCPGTARLPPDLLDAMQREQGWTEWLAAVRGFQRLHRDGVYSVVFFANVVPRTCEQRDVFTDGGSAALNAFYMQALSQGTPAVSAYDAFRSLRPSQMPGAAGHSLGNANRVKADVLFGYLRDTVLASQAPPRAASILRSVPRR
jgi:GDSL-like Lipase/Acylhydrolase family